MVKAAHVEAPLTAQSEKLLMKSISIYQEIHSLYHHLQNDLSDQSTIKMHQTLANLNARFQDAQNIDYQIAVCIDIGEDLPDSTTSLLAEREAALKKLFQANRDTKKRVESVKCLLGHEIAAMSTNRTAIKGYKPVEAETRVIVRNAF
jgi:hypothetical protein